MGLAFPGLTDVFNGTDPEKDVLGANEQYNPLFFTAFSEKVVSNPCGSSIKCYSLLASTHIFYYEISLSH
jgi:hypothetical protein